MFKGLQNEAIGGLQIGARGIANTGSLSDFNSGLKDKGRDFKSGQRDFKSVQRLRISAEQKF